MIFRVVRTVAVTVLLAACTPTALAAQWLRYPTPGVRMQATPQR
jgi:hypothetical protein